MKNIKLEYNAPVVLTFALISTAIFFMDQILPLDIIGNYFVYRGGYGLLDILRMLLCPMGHGSMEHLMGNMTLLLLIGPMIEEKYTSSVVFILMVATTVLIGLTQMIFFNTGILGASGIVFMMIILSSFTNMKKDRIPVTFILVVILFLGKEVYNGLFVNNQVSELAHILGAVVGMVYMYIENVRNKSH